jgi:hypothetical protein
MRAGELLESRVAELDQPTQNRIAWSRVRDYWEESEKNNDIGSCQFEDWPCKDLAYSVDVMNDTTDVGSIGKGSMKRIGAREADQIIASSDILSRMAARQPEIVTGPVSSARQFWVAAQNPQRRALRVVEPMQSEFQAAAEARALYAKPREGGMFTSTGACGKPGMWRMYLDMNDPSNLHGKPRKPLQMSVSRNPSPWSLRFYSRKHEGQLLELFPRLRQVSDAGRWVKLLLVRWMAITIEAMLCEHLTLPTELISVGTWVEIWGAE